MKTKKWETIMTLIKAIGFLKNTTEKRINNYKAKSRPRKTFITEMINLAGRGNYSDIKKLPEEREKNGEKSFNDKAYPLKKK